MTDEDLAQDERVQSRSIELTNQYTQELGDYCDKRVPPLLDNTEYALSCSSLLIALTRQLGRCAAAFGAANGQTPEDVRTLVFRMFNMNYDRALAAMNGEGETVQ
jgi:hypothetical protein